MGLGVLKNAVSKRRSTRVRVSPGNTSAPHAGNGGRASVASGAANVLGSAAADDEGRQQAQTPDGEGCCRENVPQGRGGGGGGGGGGGEKTQNPQRRIPGEALAAQGGSAAGEQDADAGTRGQRGSGDHQARRSPLAAAAGDCFLHFRAASHSQTRGTHTTGGHVVAAAALAAAALAAPRVAHGGGVPAAGWTRLDEADRVVARLQVRALDCVCVSLSV